jgi:uncharacterized PurR-regulated membrane protein YhhQ (DUF165 family)
MNRKTLVYLGFVILGIALVLTAAVLLYPSAMTVTDTTAGEMGKAKEGDSVEFVGQITEITGNILTVEVLQSPDGNVFNQRTGQFIYVVVESTPEYVMGSQADIKVGLVAQFRGIKINTHQITIDRIVILSGYVEGPTQ